MPNDPRLLSQRRRLAFSHGVAQNWRTSASSQPPAGATGDQAINLAAVKPCRELSQRKLPISIGRRRRDKGVYLVRRGSSFYLNRAWLACLT